jgi:hypothetical protein
MAKINWILAALSMAIGTLSPLSASLMAVGIEYRIVSEMSRDQVFSLEGLTAYFETYSRDEIRGALDHLVQQGRLIKEGHAKQTTYVIAPLQLEIEQAIDHFPYENDLEKRIIENQEWREGAMWGEPRRGHPEGAIVYHVEEVLRNVDTFYGDSPFRHELRLIALIHDTFKCKVDPSRPKSGENHHAMIARRFAENFLDDPKLLNIIEKHDDAYNAWRKGDRGDWERAHQEALSLITFFGPDLPLYVAFYECDVKTGDKTLDPFLWFLEIKLP